MLKRFILAAVPEQVNIPISLCIENGLFRKHGISLEYRITPEGTGKMLDLLEKEEIDCAFTVTDALLAGISTGRKPRFVGTFVSSPLVWSLLIRNEKVKSYNCDRILRYGISRYGSGSQTMAVYAASLKDIDKSLLQFNVANNFSGLRVGLQDKEHDAFLWEYFTSKHCIDSGEMSSLAEISTPWTAFSIALSPNSSGETVEREQLYRNCFLPALQEGVEIFINPNNYNIMIDRICTEYKANREDAELWFSRCRYAHRENFMIDYEATLKSIDVLKTCQIIKRSFKIEELYPKMLGPKI